MNNHSSTLPDVTKKIAAKWQLTDLHLLQKTRRAFVFKVASPRGPAVLKTYKALHRSGEGSGINFLRHLQPGTGPAIYLNSIWHALFDELRRSNPAEQVIHGDLNWGNVIQTDKGPRLIDPKGLRGDPAYEFAKALLKPYCDLCTSDFLDRTQARAAQLAPFVGATPRRVIQWATITLGLNVLRGKSKDPNLPALQPYLTALLDASHQT
ncbi:aminoglycoside phosphotransferase family protein [Yoonia sp. BS5-3]|uniref:Aminoglycoside phosphotransferase family protein n=1 Tax=Yoonia phaeophyticola TaxID=3137369 RepID=A0ABZ2V2M7_9RHOB